MNKTRTWADCNYTHSWAYSWISFLIYYDLFVPSDLIQKALDRGCIEIEASSESGSQLTGAGLWTYL